MPCKLLHNLDLHIPTMIYITQYRPNCDLCIDTSDIMAEGGGGC